MIAMAVGTVALVPMLHRSVFMGSEPTELTYDQLVQYGLPDGDQHVRLIDIAVSAPAAGEDAALLEAIREEESDRRWWHAILPREWRRGAALVKGAGIYPRSETKYTIPGRVHVVESSRLTRWARDTATKSFVLTGQFIEVDAGQHDRGHAFVVQPAGWVVSRAQAVQWWIAAAMLTIAGVLACGSGGLSTLMQIFFPVHALMSVCGYPLRYGRGKPSVRKSYALGGGAASIIGSGLLAYGAIFTEAANLGVTAIGYATLTLGLAAICGAVFNHFADRYDLCSLRERRKPIGGVKRMSFDQACSLDPMQEDTDPEYEEPSFRAARPDDPPAEDAARWLAEMAAIGFGDPRTFCATVRVMADREAALRASKLVRRLQTVSADEDESLFEVTEADFDVWVSRGPGGGFAAAIEADETRAVLRLISILSDGTSVLTLSKGGNLQSDLRIGSSGCYQQTDDMTLAGIMETHLTRVCSLAETRSLSVITLGPHEAEHAYRLSGRVLADIQHQYGESLLVVDEGCYGRFYHPPQPLEAVVESGRDQPPAMEPTEPSTEVESDGPAEVQEAAAVMPQPHDSLTTTPSLCGANLAG